MTAFFHLLRKRTNTKQLDPIGLCNTHFSGWPSHGKVPETRQTGVARKPPPQSSSGFRSSWNWPLLTVTGTSSMVPMSKRTKVPEKVPVTFCPTPP